MTAIENTPTNLNFLSPTGFKFQVKKLPHVNFFTQQCNIPGVSIDTNPYLANPLTKIPFAGDHIMWNELNVKFRVDEDLKDYIEIHNWIRGLTFPEDPREYAALSSQKQTSGMGLKSDASLFIMTSKRNPNFEIVFEDVFPIGLSDLLFDTMDTSIQYLEATASFAYTQFKIISV